MQLGPLSRPSDPEEESLRSSGDSYADGDDDVSIPSNRERAESFEHVDTVTGKVPWGLKFSFGAPDFATASISFLVTVHGNRFLLFTGGRKGPYTQRLRVTQRCV